MSKREFWFQLVMLSFPFTYCMSEFYLNYLAFCVKKIIQTRNLARHQCLWIFFFQSVLPLPVWHQTILMGLDLLFYFSIFSYSTNSFYLFVACIEILLPFALSSLLRISQHGCSLILVFTFLSVQIFVNVLKWATILRAEFPDYKASC